jgi:thiamine pyrophosphokinase
MSFKNLRFILPDVILCLNGVLPDNNIFLQLDSIPIIAADGAAAQLRTKGFLPNYIIGDLDSLAPEIDHWRNAKDIVIEEVSNQNSTDFEKALEHIRRQKYSAPMICGLHGGELDHTLNNWSILMRYGKIMPLAVYDAGKIALPVYESVIIDSVQGEMISLIPQPTVSLTTKGLEWNLQQEELRLGVREGARNRATNNRIALEIHSGAMLLFQKAALPYIPQVKT